MHSTHSLDTIGLEGKSPDAEGASMKSRDVTDDGGYGWVIVASTLMAFSLMPFHILTFGIFAPEFAHTFSLSESEVGLIASLRFGLFSFTGIFSGPLVQRFGCRPVAMSAVFLSTIAFASSAAATGKLSITITYGFIAGLGTGMVIIPSVVIVQQHFNRRRAIAAGISSVGMALFALICSPLARFLVDTFGWRGASLLFAGITLQMMVPTALYRPPDQPKTRHSTKIDATDLKQTCTCKFKGYILSFFNKDLLSCEFILFVVANVSRYAVLDTYFVRMPLLAQSVGIGAVQAASLPSIAAIFSTISRAGSGFLAHCIPPLILYAVFNTLSAGLVYAVPLVPNTYVAHAICSGLWCLLYGTVLGIEHTTLVTILGVKLLPLALSWIAIFMGTFQIISNLFVGWLLDETGTYRIPLWYAASVHILGSLCAIGIAVIKHREQRHDEPLKL